jgi:hypothetical protein
MKCTKVPIITLSKFIFIFLLRKVYVITDLYNCITLLVVFSASTSSVGFVLNFGKSTAQLPEDTLGTFILTIIYILSMSCLCSKALFPRLWLL